MKICYVANSRFPSERAHMTQIVHMCNAFAAQGNEVTLVVTNRKTVITEEPQHYYGTSLHFNIVRLNVPDMAGISPQLPVFLRPWAYLIQRVSFAYVLSRHVRNENYTYLYGRDEWVLWLLAKATRIPIIWESHEAKFSFIARKLIVKVKAIVVISEGIRDFYLKHGVDKSRIMVAHDAVDTSFFNTHTQKEIARREVGIETTKPVAMYIGGLDAWKGTDVFFEASKEQMFEAYVIGGKEKELSDLRKKYPHVHFLGQRPYKDLSRLQQAADVLIIPNTATNILSREYTSPLKLFSYMTSKIPIVASRIPSITAILTDDDVYFFDADNSVSLRDAIHRALEDQYKTIKAERAFKKSLTYTWDNRAKKIIEFLSQ